MVGEARSLSTGIDNALQNRNSSRSFRRLIDENSRIVRSDVEELSELLGERKVGVGAGRGNETNWSFISHETPRLRAFTPAGRTNLRSFSNSRSSCRDHGFESSPAFLMDSPRDVIVGFFLLRLVEVNDVIGGASLDLFEIVLGLCT